MRIGETIFILGRKFLLYDCDDFTRNYFKKALCIEQGLPIDISETHKTSLEKRSTAHTAISSDTFMAAEVPKKDVVKQILNANKYLRYEMKMEDLHPEDSIRRFLLVYSLADNTCKIFEPPIRNSGILGGKYLKSTLLTKPNTNPLNPEYYSPIDFHIGAIITVFHQRFEIIGADLYVYRYMQENSSKFPCEVIENVRNYMFNLGLLKDDVDKQMRDTQIDIKKLERDALGQKLEENQKAMDQCLENFGLSKGSANNNYMEEEFVIPKHDVPPFGIKPVDSTCPYPITTDPMMDVECKTEAQKIGKYFLLKLQFKKVYVNFLSFFLIFGIIISKFQPKQLYLG